MEDDLRNYNLEDENVHPLPLRVGRALLHLLGNVTDGFYNNLSQFVYGKTPVVWEMFCGPQSNLSKSCEKMGMEPVRVNLANGFDLYKTSSWDKVHRLYRAQRPRKIWVSPRCTYYCDWTDLNYSHRWELLEKYRRKERKMLRQLTEFLKMAVADGVEIYWEWPWRCRGWKEPVVMDFIEYIQRHLTELWICRVDGCRFGMKSSQGNFIQKSWKIMTSDVEFYSKFRLRCCLKNHDHEWLQGDETTKSSYYPINLCNSIARLWRDQFVPQRWISMLWTAPVQGVDTFKEVLALDDEVSCDYEPSTPGEEPDLPEQPSDIVSKPGEFDDVDPKLLESWDAQLSRFHRAAGHPTNRNLARMLSDAQVEQWKIKRALQFRCSICEENRPGGSSSKQIPPASLRALPQPWEHVGMDVGEWTIPNVDLKVKFVLMMDLCTKYKVTEVLFSYPHGTSMVESAEDILRVLTTRWLMDKPKPKIIVPDNAKSMTSQKVAEFLSDLGIALMPPPDNESWSHGVVERAIGHVKSTATLLQEGHPDQNPIYTLALATAAINSTEFNKGYSSIQWAFGKQQELSEEELQQQLSLPLDQQQSEFLRLLSRRQDAENCAREAKAKTVLGKLRNTSIRQPPRTFSMAQPVMLWRKFLPHTIYKGRKGGKKHTSRPRWVGPGRVVFHELLPGQDEEDRRQVVWVILGNILYRASVHSVRPLSPREQELFEAQGDQSHRWKELSDMIPSRNYVDVVGEEPHEEEREEPPLPDQPDSSTRIPPTVRFGMKAPVSLSGKPLRPSEGPLFDPSDLVNDYEENPEKIPIPVTDDEVTGTEEPTSLPMRRPSTSSTRTGLPAEGALRDEGALHEDGNLMPPGDEVIDDTSPPQEPDLKRARLDDDAEIVDYLDFNSLALESQEGYLMELELDFTSNRQKKMFMQNPQAFLVKKMANSEVVFKKLSEEDKTLFRRAKASEVSSFIKTEAVRRCLSWEEQQRASNSDRVLRARWVLVWKDIPEESKPEARLELKQNPQTVVHPSASKKAKARIVLLGFEHPDLLQSTFRSSAPVQSQLMRNLSLYLVAQRGWQLEGLDMSTAFLQTGAFEMEQQELWTTGVPELREALGLKDGEVMRLLKNIYGNATAPRGLWKDVDRTFTKLGGHRIIGDSSFWIWVQPVKNPRNEADRFEVIGFVGGHVDDFNRAGNLDNPLWIDIRSQIDKAYRWGTMKSQTFRHTGIDLEVCQDSADRWVNLSQTFYAESLSDLAIDPGRLRQDPKSLLSPSEMAACRASLGALQWLATQTQIQICSRVNLLLTELTVEKNLQVAREVQELIKETRQSPVELKLWHLPEVSHWQDCCIITLADQAHGNRPQGGSTGGYITMIGGPQHAKGQAGRLNILSWRSWKLKRKAISTNDGEIQSMVEGEDAKFRTRFLWCQLNGCLCDGDLLQDANRMVGYLTGIVATDSRGGFDAINKNEGPLLGLSNVRSALQGFQLREQLEQSKGSLIWVSGDWNLADALTKKSKSARLGLLQYFRNGVWKLTYDPSFIQSEKKSKQKGQSAVTQMRQLQSLIPKYSWFDETFLHNDW